MINNKNNKETAPANPLPESKSASTRAPCEDVFAPPNPRQSLGLGRPAGSAGLAKTVQPEAPPTPSDIELVIRYSRALESLLGKRLGATGTGLHERITSVERRLPVPLVKRLRWIATMRNNVVHVDGFALPSAAEYEAACKKCMEELQAVKAAPKESPAARAARLQAEDRAYVKDWSRGVGISLALAMPLFTAFFLIPNGTGWAGWFLSAALLASSFAVYCGFPIPIPLFAPGVMLRYLRTRDAGPLAAKIRWVCAHRRGAPVNYSSGSASHQHSETHRASTDASSISYPANPPSQVGDSADDAAAAALDHPAVNPATGLTMLDGGLTDIGGNPFGGASGNSLSESFANDVGGDFLSQDQF